jgi:hypothetical protein
MMDAQSKCPWCAVPHGLLFWLAALVWFAGAWATADTSTTLLALALSQGVAPTAAALSYGFAGAAGLVAGWFLFGRLARANVARIARLQRPRIWHAFRPVFVVWLCVFDGGTVLLQFYVCKDGASRLAMGAVNVAVCVGLSASLLIIFHSWRGFVPAVAAPGGAALLAADAAAGAVDAEGGAS